MDRSMAQVPPPACAQVPDQNQDKGKAPQVSGQDHDQQQAQAQLPDHDHNQLQAQAQVLAQEQAQAQVLAQYQDRGKAPLLQDEDKGYDYDDEDQARAQVPNQASEEKHQQAGAPQVPNQDQDAVPRRNMGRQKVELTKVQNAANLQVTFSKRRSGLFKKASELAILSGVELALIVFSPGNKAFSFGHPSLDDVIDRFLTRVAPPPLDATGNLMLAHQSDNVCVLNSQLTNMQALFEAERQKKVVLDHARAVSQNQRRWETPIEEQSRDELVALKGAMLNLHGNLANYIEMRMQREQQNPSAFQPGPGSLGARGNGEQNPLAFRPGAGFMGAGGSEQQNPLAFPPGAGSLGARGGGNGGGEKAAGSNSFGGALPFPTGPMFPQFPTGLSSLGGGGGGGALPFFTWPSFVDGRSNSFSGPLPPFLGESSSFPSGMSSLGHGGALPFPPGGSGQTSFGPGRADAFPTEPSQSGHGRAGSLPMEPGSSGHGQGGALQIRPGPPTLVGECHLPIEPSHPGNGSGSGRPPRRHGRGRVCGHGRGRGRRP